MIDRAARERLPREVIDLAARLISEKAVPTPHVSFRQTGRMRQGYDAAWMTFRAVQQIACSNCAFSWRAKMGPLGMVHVTDAFEAGAGELSVRLFGLFTMVRPAVSADLNRGELMRYLAEIAWAPSVIILNESIDWEVVSPDLLKVSAGTGDARATVSIHLDAEGRIGAISASDRPRAVNDRFECQSWRGEFSDYRLHEGFWLPFSGRVGWEAHQATEWCWEGEITDWAAQ